MDASKLAYFLAKYRECSEEELAETFSRRSTLAEEAAHALETALTERGISRDLLSPRSAEFSDSSPQRRSGTSSAAGPVGVGGWLLLLAIGLIALGPLMGAGRINADIIAAEHQYPNLQTLTTWSTYKVATWGTFLVVCALSVYAGIGLLNKRDISVVKRAKVILWVIGPGASFVVGTLIPLIVFGNAGVDPQFVGGLIGSIIIAGIWTAYLSKSKRVRATYAAGPQT